MGITIIESRKGQNELKYLELDAKTVIEKARKCR